MTSKSMKVVTNKRMKWNDWENIHKHIYFKWNKQKCREKKWASGGCINKNSMACYFLKKRKKGTAYKYGVHINTPRKRNDCIAVTC